MAVVDKVARAFRRLPEGWDGVTVIGSGFDRNDLEAAGATEARALAAVTSGDNSNILTARIARETYGITNVVARIYDPRRAQIYLHLGIPTVATVPWTIGQVLERLVPETVVGQWSDASGQMAIAERAIPDAWAGRLLDPLTEPGKVMLVAVTRAGSPRLDVTGVVGQEGDVLHFMVMKDAIGLLDRRLADPTGSGSALNAAAGRQGPR